MLLKPELHRLDRIFPELLQNELYSRVACGLKTADPGHIILETPEPVVVRAQTLYAFLNRLWLEQAPLIVIHQPGPPALRLAFPPSLDRETAPLAGYFQGRNTARVDAEAAGAALAVRLAAVVRALAAYVPALTAALDSGQFRPEFDPHIALVCSSKACSNMATSTAMGYPVCKHDYELYRRGDWLHFTITRKEPFKPIALNNAETETDADAPQS